MPKVVSKRPTPATLSLLRLVATGRTNQTPPARQASTRRATTSFDLLPSFSDAPSSSWSRVLFTPPHLPPTHEQAYIVVLQAANMAATNQAPSMEEESEAGKCGKPSGTAVFSCPSSNAQDTTTHISLHPHPPPHLPCLTPPSSPPHTPAKALWEITNSPGLAKKGPSCLTPRGPARQEHLLGFPTPQGVGHGSPSMNYNRHVGAVAFCLSVLVFKFEFGLSLF